PPETFFKILATASLPFRFFILPAFSRWDAVYGRLQAVLDRIAWRELAGTRAQIEKIRARELQTAARTDPAGLLCPIFRDVMDDAHAARARAGSRTTNSEPAPGPGLVADTRPPCRTTSDFTKASPRPSPLIRRSLKFGPCTCRSNTFGRSSAVMPRP